MSEFDKFIVWESLTRDTIDFKKAYVDIADDLVAGLLLSQIVYYYLPDKKGNTNKLRVEKNGEMWIAKQRTDWWDECRITPAQFDLAFKKLSDKGLVEKCYHRFNGFRTMHIRLLQDKFMEAWNAAAAPVLGKHESRSSGNTNPGLSESRRPLTQTTAEITAQTTKEKKEVFPEPNSQDAATWPDDSNLGVVEKEPPRKNGGGYKPQADPVADALAAQALKGQRSWTVPAEAGGADPWRGLPLVAFCDAFGIPALSGEPQVQEFARELRKVGEKWKAAPDEVARAIEQIPKSQFSWLAIGAPKGKGWEDAMNVLMPKVLMGEVASSEGWSHSL